MVPNPPQAGDEHTKRQVTFECLGLTRGDAARDVAYKALAALEGRVKGARFRDNKPAYLAGMGGYGSKPATR